MSHYFCYSFSNLFCLNVSLLMLDAQCHKTLASTRKATKSNAAWCCHGLNFIPSF